MSHSLDSVGRCALLLVDLHVDGELHLIADQGRRKLRPEAIVAALDRSAGGEAADRLALHRLWRRRAVKIQRHALRHAVDGQVSNQPQLAAGVRQRGRLKRHYRVLRNIEEGVGLQVRVPLHYAGRDGRGVNGRGHRRFVMSFSSSVTVPFTLPNAPWTWLTPM